VGNSYSRSPSLALSLSTSLSCVVPQHRSQNALKRPMQVAALTEPGINSLGNIANWDYCLSAH
jgi:hypothetical protein